MESLDLRYICKVIGNLSGVPIRVYNGENLVFFHALVRLPRDPMEVYREDIWKIRASVGYFVTPHF